MLVKSTEPPISVLPSLEQASSLHSPPSAWSPDAQFTKPVAVLICHGMGQQVPFETLASIAERLQAPGEPVPVVRHVHFTDTKDSRQTKWLPRAEISVPGPAGEPARRVHVYEAYWAPLTEGVISLKEVIRFMATAGVRGLWKSLSLFKKPFLKPFERWVFGREREYDIHLRTPVLLLSALLVVLGLVAINTVLTLTLAQKAIRQQLGGPLVTVLTLDLLVLLAIMAVTLAPTVFSMRRYSNAAKQKKTAALRFGALERTAAAGQVIFFVAVFVMALVMGYHYLKLHDETASYSFWLMDARDGMFHVSAIVIVWGIALGLSLIARSFIVQYMGDVAIYLDSYKVDKFNTVRQQIKSVAFGTACTLYGAREAGSGAEDAPFAYDHVVLVGHSLGSVVTYDALNATLHLDETMSKQLHIADRTGTLITFGSPLDKTAYLFDSQHPEAPIRDGLAASVQPLIRDEAARASINWLNLHAKTDIVSGALDFYQLPHRDTPPEALKVHNVADPQAITPIAAHTQYWTNPLLAETLRQAIHLPSRQGRGGTPPAATASA